MRTYYLYHQHPNGRFAARDVIEAKSRAKAIALAEQSSRSGAMELWLGPVMVKAFPAPPPTRQQTD